MVKLGQCSLSEVKARRPHTKRVKAFRAAVVLAVSPRTNNTAKFARLDDELQKLSRGELVRGGRSW